MEKFAAMSFLREAAEYFERRDTKGEDRAHWSNIFNAKNCREIAQGIAQVENWPDIHPQPGRGSISRAAADAIRDMAYGIWNPLYCSDDARADARRFVEEIEPLIQLIKARANK